MNESVQFSHSVVSSSLRPHGLQHARPPCPSPTPGVYSLMSIELVMPSNHLTLCHPLLLSSIFPSIRVFSNESVLRTRWLSGKEFSYQYRRHRFTSRVGKILWRRAWQPTPVFLPREAHGQRSLAGYSPWGHKQFEKT